MGMSRGMKFVKGMGIGLAVGCMVGAVGTHCMRNGKRGFKKNVGKALKDMSELVEQVGELF